MPEAEPLDHISIDVRSHRLLGRLLQENPKLHEILRSACNGDEALASVRRWVIEELEERPEARRFLGCSQPGPAELAALPWSDLAAIRLLDYIDNAGRTFPDLNLRGRIALSDPIRLLWLAVHRGTGGARPAFFHDMLWLFRQFLRRSRRQLPSRERVERWMRRHPAGLEPGVVQLREENRDRILGCIIRRIEAGEVHSSRYCFHDERSDAEKLARAREWWNESAFHLLFAARSPQVLNEMLGGSLDPDTMRVLEEARDKGIPYFVNPYYLSLLQVRVPRFAIGADLAIRDYVIYSPQLVREFGHIVAWEKEDQVKPGHPNAAGWILPTARNIHRRYPDVAVLIPDSQGRACGGLCASCQRMYDFQSGHLGFDLEKLRPRESWRHKLTTLMDYFERDSQLCDILITGGDALMSSDHTLEQLLDAICEMARRKRAANRGRPDGEKYAEISRVRLGTRLPVYLPQRITPALEGVLRRCRERARSVGIRQLIVQTHFESPMEVTPESRRAVERLLATGWTVTNQHVLTAAASRRGHAAKLRQVLGEIGVIPYYTFSVKGYMENWHGFATNARAVQEQVEEKVFGAVPPAYHDLEERLGREPRQTAERIAALRTRARLPFLATDRNVLNLPGVGKSLTFRVIGITRYGRRILEFAHDSMRSHSPAIQKMGRVVVIESKSISEYVQYLEDAGEDASEYQSLYGYSLGVTEPLGPIFQRPPYDFAVTDEITNLDLREVSTEECRR